MNKEELEKEAARNAEFYAEADPNAHLGATEREAVLHRKPLTAVLSETYGHADQYHTFCGMVRALIDFRGTYHDAEILDAIAEGVKRLDEARGIRSTT